MPALTRSAIIARSNSANTPIIWNIALPAGVVGVDALGCEIVAVHRDNGISGAKGRNGRPGFNALCKGSEPP
jgi:hypothetical protein